MRKLIVSLLITLSLMVGSSTVQADLIVRDFFDVELGEVIDDPNRDGQVLPGIGFFFYDDPINAQIGDTIRLNLFFEGRKRIQVFDSGNPTAEIVSGALFVQEGDPTINAFTRVSFQMFGVTGRPGPNPQSRFINSGGGGIGIGSSLNLTDSFVSFTGASISFEILNAASGFPASFISWSGLQLNADRIQIVPVPEPGTLALLGAGLIGMGFARRRKAA